MGMDIRANSYIGNINNNRNNKVSSPRITISNPDLKKDMFFNGINKVFTLSKAKSENDIPKDANIFIFDYKTKLKIPPEQNIKECILSDKNIGFWKSLSLSEDDLSIKLKDNNVEYAHGDVSNPRKPTYGIIELDNSYVKQIAGVTKVRLKNNSKADYIDNVDGVHVFDSKVGTIKTMGHVLIGKGGYVENSTANFGTYIYPEAKANKVTGDLIICYGDDEHTDLYSEINELTTDGDANINQSKIKDLNAGDLTLKNSVADHAKANYALEFSNNVIDHLELGDVVKMSDTKVRRFDLKNCTKGLCLEGKIQIDELNIYDDDVKLFFYPKSEWGKKNDNYIKRINVAANNPKLQYSDKPVLRLQGDMNIGTVVFENGTGKVEVVGPKAGKLQRVINGFAKYNMPKIKPPDPDEINY